MNRWFYIPEVGTLRISLCILPLYSEEYRAAKIKIKATAYMKCRSVIKGYVYLTILFFRKAKYFIWNTLTEQETSQTFILPRVYASVINNNGFWIGFINT
jgi:hypothetical protein